MTFLTGALILLAYGTFSLLPSVETLYVDMCSTRHALKLLPAVRNSLQCCDELNCITVGPGTDSKDETDDEKECRNCRVESQACSNNPTETSLQCCDELELFCMKDPFIKTFLCVSFCP